MKKFEHLVEMTPVLSCGQVIKNLEQEGWELITCFPVPEELEGIRYYRMFFKREKVEESDES